MESRIYAEGIPEPNERGAGQIGMARDDWREYAVTTSAHRWLANWNIGGLCRPQGLWCAAVFGLAAGILPGAAQADNFANVYYDARKDQLVVTMSYLGTNPDHTFSLQWGTCKDSPDGTTREIAVDVLDSQWQDAARQNFKMTTRFSLADLTCRPATLTLRTAPRFLYTLQIPARFSPRP
jgi:hypothetical protein